MRSALLINNIKVGEIDIDDVSDVMVPYLETFIDGDGYTVLMEDYHFDFLKESVQVVYLVNYYILNADDDQEEYYFDTEVIYDDQQEVYQLMRK